MSASTRDYDAEYDRTHGDPAPDDVPAWNRVVADLRREVLLLRAWHARIADPPGWGTVATVGPHVRETPDASTLRQWARDALAGKEPPK